MPKLAHVLVLCFLIAGTSPAAAVAQGANPTSPDVSFGIRIYPGAKPRPDVAAAVEAYYRPELRDGQRIDAAVFVTTDPFQTVHDYYGPHMEPGKWGWRKKSYPVRHQTLTLAFMRARLAERANGDEEAATRLAMATTEKINPPYPGELEPFFGEAEVPQEEFESSLEELAQAHSDAEIRIVEGVRRVQGDPDGGMVRIVVERPYIDVARMELVDQTRITLIKVAEAQ
jgi:hypothetical protein